MPRDNSGNYTLPAGNPVITDTTITSDWANTTMADLGNEMTNSLSRDGQGGMLAPLPFTDGDVNNPSITFNLEPTLGWFRPTTNIMALAALGDTHLQYDAANAVLGLLQGASPRFTLVPSVVGGGGVITFFNAGGTVLQASISVDESTGRLTIARFDNLGLITSFGIEDDGNVSVDGAAPTLDENLTRKDYVDGNFARYLQGYRVDAGVHEDFTGDLDSIDFNSVYSFISANTTNNPVGIGATAIICTDLSTASPAFSVQRVFDIDPVGYKMWIRTENAGIWDAWKQVIDGDIVEYAGGNMITSLPTSDPAVAGALWNNAGVVNVSP